MKGKIGKKFIKNREISMNYRNIYSLSLLFFNSISSLFFSKLNLFPSLGMGEGGASDQNIYPCATCIGIKYLILVGKFKHQRKICTMVWSYVQCISTKHLILMGKVKYRHTSVGRDKRWAKIRPGKIKYRYFKVGKVKKRRQR